ncbi:MAG: 50S ribosomal protein L24, large subunit ribosomal protein L24 [Microgenomates group bacterium GW2011_GWC1_41_20]|uniref:Large ribosomal subunit protein uL24 n=7 Tax=Candidatus Woeseibacteriota TaxID=1752722 RepID=A0A0G0RU88_9BACT|nr:MAG: 50S ribosomal protein L24 [Candidatus Woesebacteria bacterium GW2011_GWB1_40_12]KKR56239.1 MAG: 50S ribosomal protein L24 [Candidatus Woesebacteria bacterium GW2011_GWF1_40_24]KKR90746.1 MAG: 50S ribosomal protein L24 [Candidatus Woesebacteria bacterium GW2011_GWD1_41_12]KKS00782.1 MAG: 50S ribosomal protein L24, large subunit ribosomal protein L24 [Microgenomates group bacterium GW2011_GWC1_41_20]KKS05779.1 MAG: 50S ribosomal protein L24 [Candidatus Woesebacteria bacterium GW2011_GWE1_
MIKFKTGDTVKITAGKDKGRDGKIEKILTTEEKAVIPGVNLYKKHVKGFGEVKGGIYDIPRALGFGKIALICPKCKKMTRVGFKFAGEEKVRICKKCGKEIDTK